jgi:tetratricopeptide (TPR) repeat protein
MERYADLAQHLEACLKIKTLDKSQVYWKYATMEELQLNFEDAIRYYEKAILLALNDDRIKDLQNNIERCRLKLDISRQHQK